MCTQLRPEEGFIEGFNFQGSQVRQYMRSDNNLTKVTVDTDNALTMDPTFNRPRRDPDDGLRRITLIGSANLTTEHGQFLHDPDTRGAEPATAQESRNSS